MTVILKKSHSKHTTPPKAGAQWLKKHYTKKNTQQKNYIVKATK